MRIGLSVRLYLSYAAVIITGAGTTFGTVRILAPRLFDERMAMMDAMASGNGAMMRGFGFGRTIREAFTDSLTNALAIGLVAALVVAALVVVILTRRLLKPLAAVRAATRRIADGDYQSRVPAPAEPEVAALAHDVNTLAANLAETEQRRTRLLGDVAHEMRTPLTTLDGYVEGMIDGVFPADEATLDALSAELRRLHRLADDLAALSRAQEHRFNLALGDTDLTELVQSAATRLGPQFSDAGVDLHVDAPMPVHVVADADRVTQVITNLLGNALVATGASGAVNVTVEKAENQVRIRVRDSGVGLASDDLTRIFERFYRAPGGVRRSQGSGVGLTIAREIAHAHGGTLIASSEGIGRGATFTLTLPL